MTNSPFRDAIAIDTNVFENLLNPQENRERHINRLLTHLIEECVALLLDKDGRIWGEYLNRIGPILANTDDRGAEIYILRYWIGAAPCLHSAVDLSDELMTIIKKVIHETPETVDRILVYVALSKGRVLVSNDHKHIVSGPVRESGQTPRRDRLKRSSRKVRPKGGNILTSKEAEDMI